MIFKHLGTQIDIHGGGADLMYPHHESEIAQSEAFTHKKPFVKTWMHAAMLVYKGEKMSKSLGNMIFVSDLLKNYSADAIRHVLLSHHYREVWEFQMEELVESDKTVKLLKEKISQDSEGDLALFEAALDDDMDTPKALLYVKECMAGETLKKSLDLLGFSLE